MSTYLSKKKNGRNYIKMLLTKEKRTVYELHQTHIIV